jgi:hypothetical protein
MHSAGQDGAVDAFAFGLVLIELMALKGAAGAGGAADVQSHRETNGSRRGRKICNTLLMERRTRSRDLFVGVSEGSVPL